MQDSRTEKDRIREPLYVGRIISQTFSILFRKIGYLLIIGGIPALVLAYTDFQLAPSQSLEGPITIAPDRSNEVAIALVMTGLRLLIVALITALMATLVHAIKAGHPVRISRLFIATLKALPRTITMLLLMFAGIGFVLPFIYFGIISPLEAIVIALILQTGVLTVFLVALPATIVEKAWIGGFVRSLHLTKGYRWACLGVLLITSVCTYLILAAIELSFFALDYYSLRGLPATLVIRTSIHLLLPACLATAASLTYMRLREIKEFGIAEDVGKVFA